MYLCESCIYYCCLLESGAPHIALLAKQKELMRKLFFVIVLVTLPTCVAVAQQAGQQPNQPPKVGARAVKIDPCAKYGPGFIQVRGSDVCIKIGGSVEASGGASR